ncbi:MAG TPA: AbrB/MazE/SpoVT family DNA-binding domain-containing protein [Tepidiformaceae bacterium]|nr:AbrB/MazE/SpoVT family DNA-binding domain-containing protein [Tepidiformaceae bacterium]
MKRSHIARISKRNTITIPVEMLRRLGVQPGDPVDVTDEDGVITISNPIARIERLAGSLGFPGMPVLSDSELRDAIRDARDEAAQQRSRRASA